MKPMSQRERRLVAILILVAIVALAWLAIIAPILSGFHSRADERADLLAEHRRNQRVAAQLPILRRMGAAQRSDDARFSLPAASKEEAVLQLRARLRRIAQVRKIVIKNVQEAEAAEGWVAVQAEGVLTIDQLTAFLGALKQEEPVSPIRSLAISADAAFQSGRAGPMEVRFEVSAPYRAPAGR